jgi:hypothetical protein
MDNTNEMFVIKRKINDIECKNKELQLLLKEQDDILKYRQEAVNNNDETFIIKRKINDIECKIKQLHLKLNEQDDILKYKKEAIQFVKEYQNGEHIDFFLFYYFSSKKTSAHKFQKSHDLTGGKRCEIFRNAFQDRYDSKMYKFECYYQDYNEDYLKVIKID